MDSTEKTGEKNSVETPEPFGHAYTASLRGEPLPNRLPWRRGQPWPDQASVKAGPGWQQSAGCS